MKIENLTGLRAFAAIWVVLLHLRYGDSALEYGPFAVIFKTGATGVIIFFALSGFILAHVHGNDFNYGIKLKELLRFLWLRLARIYPVHFFLLLLYTTGRWEFGPNDNQVSFAMNLTLTHAWGLFGINGLNWNMPSWSISAEWFCYLLFPLLAFVTAKVPKKLLPAYCILIILLASQLYPAILNKQLGFAYFAQVTLAFLVFVTGYCLRIIAPRLGDSNLIWTMVLYFSIGGIAYSAATGWHSHDLLAIFAGLISLALFKLPPQFLFANRVSVYLGEISYSLYMSHIMTFVVLRNEFGDRKMLPLALELAVVIVVAAFLYHAVESPARTFMRRFFIMHRDRTKTTPSGTVEV